VEAQGARLRPPEAVTCPRNDLTAFTGVVTYYRRSAGRVVMKMRTDENTSEHFVIRYKGEDPGKIFLLRAETFKSEDLKQVESAKGVLQKGMRATVWVCKDGTKIIDWQPPEK